VPLRRCVMREKTRMVDACLVKTRLWCSLQQQRIVLVARMAFVSPERGVCLSNEGWVFADLWLCIVRTFRLRLKVATRLTWIGIYFVSPKQWPV
jgi:hypothetical protein